MKLLFAGQQPVSFVRLGVEVAPGEVFEVPEEVGAALLGRADVLPVPEDPPPVRRRASKSAAPADPVEGGSVSPGVAPDSDVTSEEA